MPEQQLRRKVPLPTSTEEVAGLNLGMKSRLLQSRPDFPQLTLHVLAWLPLLWLMVAYFSGRLSINPIQSAIQFAGRTAIWLLTLSLACTPLNLLTGWRKPLRWRRPLGLYAFLYAALHLFLIVGVDYGGDIQFLWADFSAKPYIFVGAGAFLILAPLAITSFDWWKKRLGKNWKRLHRLVYLAGLLAVFHFAWARKGNLWMLSGDILHPLLLGLLLTALLALRLPSIRRRLTVR